MVAFTVPETLSNLSVPVERFHGSLVHPPRAVLTQKGTLSQVFTPLDLAAAGVLLGNTYPVSHFARSGGHNASKPARGSARTGELTQ